MCLRNKRGRRCRGPWFHAKSPTHAVLPNRTVPYEREADISFLTVLLYQRAEGSGEHLDILALGTSPNWTGKMWGMHSSRTTLVPPANMTVSCGL
jgi:hypothetical protein